MKRNLTSLVLSHDPVWAIEAKRGLFLWQQLSLINVEVHQKEFAEAKAAEASEVEARGPGSDRAEKPFDTYGSIAIISIVGPMSKAPTSFSSGTSTVQARRLIRAAAADPDITSILIKFDSPGGSVSGTADLAADIAAANRRKDCIAYVEDCCCSAALWAASQCNAIYANSTAIVGSIGTYMVVEDWSQFYENQGVQVHVISTGPNKGAGIEGTAITPEQLAAWQEMVNDLNEQFLSAVAKGRSISRARVEELATGETWVGQKAVTLGLVDGIQSLDDVLNSMQKTPARKAASAQENVFASENPAPIAGPLGHSLDSVLTAVKGAQNGVNAVLPRLTEVKNIRESQGRVFSPERLEQMQGLQSEIRILASDLDALVESCESLGKEPEAAEEAVEGPESHEVDAMEALRRESSLAQLSVA